MSHLLHHAVFIHFMLTVLKLNIFLICSSVMQSYAVRERVAVSCLPLRPISVSLPVLFMLLQNYRQDSEIVKKLKKSNFSTVVYFFHFHIGQIMVYASF